ncbi:tetratricopeptide repeat protein [Phytohabitans houttuyneae]|uniref:tetratricopeptide repeat protein n=1 Tax=Phytohabitans houttuyneae TaxID=1076126 RepID=UPI0015652B09|nr:hypothetical protein [Phytohabitans houttuyneae]
MARRPKLRFLPSYTLTFLLLGTVAAGGVLIDLAIEATGDTAAWPRALAPVRSHPFIAIAALGAILLFLPIINTLYARTGPEPATSDDLADMEERLHDRFDSAELARAGDDDRLLRRLPPYARYLLEQEWDHDEVWQLVSVFVDENTDPIRVAHEWAAQPPDALDQLSGNANLVVAEVLMAYKQAGAALIRFEAALSRGVSPRPYWLYRTAHAALHAQGQDSLTATGYLQAAQAIDPDYPLVVAALLHEEGRFEDARAALAGWKAATRCERDQAALVLSAALAGHDRVDAAITALEAVAHDTEAPALLLRLAEMLRHRSVVGNGDSRWKDAFRAVEVALRARNLRRAWRGDSAEAVVVAGEAAVLADDAQQVWSITRPPPEGTATEAEAADDRVLPLAAMGAALTGRVGQAREFAASLPEGLVKWRMEAEIAAGQSVGGDNSGTISAWRRVLDASTTDEDRLHALRALALEGVADFDVTEALRERHPEAVTEIETTQRVMAASGPEGEEMLRRLESETALASVRRAELLRAADDPLGAAEVLVDATDRWKNPRLLLMAIDSYMDAGAWERAEAAAQRAVAEGGIWPGRATVLRRLVTIQATLMNWDALAAACRALLELDPNDEDARWNLAQAEFSAGEIEKAWRTIQRAGDTQPTIPSRAVFLLELSRRFAKAEEVAQTALALLQAFPDDELVHAAAINAVTMRFDSADIPDPLGQTITVAWSAFIERYPESRLIRSYSIREGDSPLADIEPMLRRQGDTYREALGHVRDQLFPIGLLDRVVGKPYAAIFPFRPLGYHRAESAATRDRVVEMEHARDALAKGCIIDASALYTLALIPDIAPTLTAMLRRPSTTAASVGDLVSADDFFSIPSSGTIGFDPDRGQIFLTDPSPETQGRQQELVRTMLRTARTLRRITHPALVHVPRVTKDRDPVWLLNLDAAKDSGVALWADDLGLRQLAHTSGIRTFGTISLIRVARERGRISADEDQDSMRALVKEYVVDIPFDEEILVGVAQEQQWRPEAVAAAMSRAASWVDIEPAINVIRSALRNATDDHLVSWTSAALYGLKAASPAANLYPNLTAITTALLCERWARPTHASALAAALRYLEPEQIERVFREALAEVWQHLTSTFDVRDALTVYLYLVSELDEIHRQFAVQIVLQPIEASRKAEYLAGEPALSTVFVRDWLRRLSEAENERDAIAHIEELFGQTGATTRRAAGGGDYADLVVWEDGLAPRFGLPIVVEVISGSRRQPAIMQDRLNGIAASSGSRTLLVLTWDSHTQPVRWTAEQNTIIVASARDLAQILTTGSLAASLERLITAARPV